MSLPLNGTWMTGAPMPTARHGFGCEVIGNKIYCIGGSSATDGWVSNQSNVLEIYDTTTNEWTTGAPAPRRLYTPGTAVYNGKIYMFGGGYDVVKAYGNVSVYDPEIDAWSEVPTSLPTPRLGLSCCTVEDKIYCIGGQESSDFYSRVDIYDVVNNAWTSGQNMPETNSFSCCLYYNAKLYVVGGMVVFQNGSGIYSKKVYAYDIENNIWEYITDFVKTTGLHCTDIQDDNIYVATDNLFYCYNITDGTWIKLPMIPTSRALGHQHAIANNKFYLLGGSSAIANTNEIYPAEDTPTPPSEDKCCCGSIKLEINIPVSNNLEMLDKVKEIVSVAKGCDNGH